MSRIYSLLWLRYKYIATNKLVLIQTLFPLALVFIMKFIFRSEKGVSENDLSLYLLSLISGMVYSMSAGSLVAAMVGEEKEKNNFRTLMLSGVKTWEYLLSVVFYPILVSVLSFVALPLMLNLEIHNWLLYLLVSSLSAVTVILLNFFVSLLAKNMTQANIYSMVIMMASIYIPMIVANNTKLRALLDFSYIGANTHFFNRMATFSLSDKSFLALVGWLVLAVMLSVFAYRKNKVLV